MDIRPVDILAQRQHVRVARPTLKAFDQEQSLATVHHAIEARISAAIHPGSAQVEVRPHSDTFALT